MKYIYLAISIILFTSCEEVIDLSLTEGPKRLVIDANINWEKDKPGAEQSIKISTTSGFYDLTVPVVNGAVVKVLNLDSGVEFDFDEENNTGIYKTTTFNPVLNNKYQLTVEYEGETFTAEETMISVPSIIVDRIEQTSDNVFGTESIKVEFFYQDTENAENFYLGQFSYPEFNIDKYRTRNDQFSDGTENSFFVQDELLIPGETITFYLYGASERNFNYMDLLLDQTRSGGPFATPPAAVKGNCINETNPDKKPYGYFRLSEMSKIEYEIKEIE